MAIRPTKPKRKKNPFRLSSDRQPGITKANKGKKTRRAPKFIPIPKGPNIPKLERPLGKPTPEQLKKIQDYIKRLLQKKKNPAALGKK